jgi:4-azaleucine resistance transporter AzlC
MQSNTAISSAQYSNSYYFWRGAIACLPLCVAVIPWGILAGSFAIEAGLTPIEAQAMSAILFAGSAQLVAVGMFKTGVGLATMLLTTFFITSRHFLYSVSMRSKISPLPLRWRLGLGFWLTDELFAICGSQSKEEFNPWYALGVGTIFYLVWNGTTLLGIVAGSYIPSLNEMGLDFAVAATFIAIVVPTIKSIATLVTVVSSLFLSVLFAYWEIESGLIIASVSGMVIGYLCDTLCSGKMNNVKQQDNGDTQ